MPKSFRTILPPVDYDFKINHQSEIISIGSCFAENISEKMTDLKFKVSLNPFGILYNPISIDNAINYLLLGKRYEAEDLFQHNGLWHSYDHHGKFSKPKQEATLQAINEAITSTSAKLKNANVLIITFGSGFVFEEVETGRIVANCHKVPAKHFRRRRLSLEEIIQPLTVTFEQLKVQNPKLRILLSVSPVRHIRDGLIENNCSKAVLHLAVDSLVGQFDFADYFPAYELVLDDLRDYRFFNDDMVHPSDAAVNYVWEYFADAFFDKKTMELNGRIERITLGMSHRPFNAESEEYRLFLLQLKRKINALEAEFGYLDLGLTRDFLK